MAIRPIDAYPGQTAPVSPEYPHGGAKNETAPGNFDGTPYELAMLNDIFGLEQALLKAAEITPSGNSDTALNKTSSQYMQAILHMVTTGATFIDSGGVNAYVLSVVDDNPAPAAYRDKMTIAFTPTNTNTGASTVDVEGLGVKDIFAEGVALIAGALRVGGVVTLYFDLANDRFNLGVRGANLGQANAVDLTLTGDATSPPDANTLVKDNIIKAALNLDGTGVIAIRGAHNVLSVVDNGPGNYTVNWDRAFLDTNYSATSGINEGSVCRIANYLVGSVDLDCRSTIFNSIDIDIVNIHVTGNQ